MTATHGVGVYGNAVGVTTPLDMKMAQLGLFAKTAANTIRPGLFWDGNATIVSGKPTMSLDIRALTAVLTRGATSGAVFLSNDSVLNVTKDTTGTNLAAPVSNSVYWNVFIWQREFSLDGTDSNPVIGVLVGTASASPSVPALTSFPGAISLATVLVPAGTTATNSGTTITQTAPFTTVDGGKVVTRTTTEMNLYTPLNADARAWNIADAVTYRWDGVSAWKPWESDWISWSTAPTNLTVGTGGSAATTQRYKWIGGRLYFDFKYVLGSSGQSVTGNPTLNLPVSVTVLIPNGSLANGDGAIRDVSVPSTPAFVKMNIVTATTVTVQTYTGTVANISSTAPMTWAAGDILAGGFWADPA